MICELSLGNGLILVGQEGFNVIQESLQLIQICNRQLANINPPFEMFFVLICPAKSYSPPNRIDVFVFMFPYPFSTIL